MSGGDFLPPDARAQRLGPDVLADPPTEEYVISPRPPRIQHASSSAGSPAQSDSGGGREEHGEAVRRPSEGAVEAPSENQM